MESDANKLTSKKRDEVIDNTQFSKKKVDSNDLECKKPYSNIGSDVNPCFRCRVCVNFEATTRAALLLHVVQCHNSSVFKLEHLDLDNSVVKFDNQNIQKQTREISRKVFECDVCNMKFSNGANMRRHKMRHTGVKPYECRVCQKR